LQRLSIAIQERYKTRRKLGVGAVYEGYDHQLRRKVAVKRLLNGDNAGPSKETVDELLKECHSLSALNSPNIVSLFDFGQDSDGPFVVMELPEGETLETLIQLKRPLETT
jgi:serine/threonine protein kinase